MRIKGNVGRSQYMCIKRILENLNRWVLKGMLEDLNRWVLKEMLEDLNRWVFKGNVGRSK